MPTAGKSLVGVPFTMRAGGGDCTASSARAAVLGRIPTRATSALRRSVPITLASLLRQASLGGGCRRAALWQRDTGLDALGLRGAIRLAQQHGVVVQADEQIRTRRLGRLVENRQGALEQLLGRLVVAGIHARGGEVAERDADAAIVIAERLRRRGDGVLQHGGSFVVLLAGDQ